MIKTVTSMLDNVLRIATRQSPLALWQAHYVKQRLEACHEGLRVELVPMVTRGDVILDTPLAKVGGKGLFVKELELALLEDRADIAVHSMKDVPVDFPEGLGLVTIASAKIRATPLFQTATTRWMPCHRAASLARQVYAASASWPSRVRTWLSAPCAATSVPVSASSITASTTLSFWRLPA